ncbi:hypothetical protein IT412_01455 [Candidatus Peregrinibacteria bacterium]|nr:hypothetical protein [Candidatus Peregrinibacteria bacterium]
MENQIIKLEELSLADRQLLEKCGQEAFFKAKKRKTILKSKELKLNLEKL